MAAQTGQVVAEAEREEAKAEAMQSCTHSTLGRQ